MTQTFPVIPVLKKSVMLLDKFDTYLNNASNFNVLPRKTQR